RPAAHSAVCRIDAAVDRSRARYDASQPYRVKESAERASVAQSEVPLAHATAHSLGTVAGINKSFFYRLSRPRACRRYRKTPPPTRRLHALAGGGIGFGIVAATDNPFFMPPLARVCRLERKTRRT